MKHVLILDLSLNGHHSSYLEHIASAYMDMGCFVTITFHHVCQSYPVIEKLKSKYKYNLNLDIVTHNEWHSVIRSYGGNFGSDVANWFVFRKKYLEIQSKHKIDYVFIPYIDYCLNTIGLFGSPFGSTLWGGICMQASVHHFKYNFLKSKIKHNWIKKHIFFRLLKNKTLSTLFTIDELLLNFVREADCDLAKNIQYLGDPAEFKGDHTRASARKELGIPDDSVVILVYGAVSSRKGLDLLIPALSHPDIPTLLHLLIVGEQEVSMEHFFNSKEVTGLIKIGRMHIINNFVDEATQQMAFAASDLVWLGYRNHFSMSGVLVLAAIARKVVISTNEGLIGWHTREKRLGITVDVRDIQAVKKALLKLFNDSNRQNYQKNIDPIFEGNTWDNAIKLILNTKEHF
jgi:glycosyltransferase involved in cell wall biosynthesis